MSDLKWESPPSPQANRRGQSKWKDIVDQLKQRPGEWAIVAEPATPERARWTASNLNNGRYPPMPKDAGFEIRISAPSGGPYRVYARYVGNGGAP